MNREEQHVLAVIEGLRRAITEPEHRGRKWPMATLVEMAVRLAWRTWDDAGLITPEPLPAREYVGFRYCRVCGVDCDPDSIDAPEPVHAPDCPGATGVHVVDEDDLRCWSCRVTRVGLRCSRCHEELQVGDSYTHVMMGAADVVGDGQQDVVDVELLVCLGCAAQAAIGESSHED